MYRITLIRPGHRTTKTESHDLVFLRLAFEAYKSHFELNPEYGARVRLQEACGCRGSEPCGAWDRVDDYYYPSPVTPHVGRGTNSTGTYQTTYQTPLAYGMSQPYITTTGHPTTT